MIVDGAEEIAETEPEISETLQSMTVTVKYADETMAGHRSPAERLDAAEYLRKAIRPAGFNRRR